ncbi:hypothetical protein AYO08_08290 [Pseudomonas putida]|nr:hypothetical protein AYO08_08290 [Pseudomonas putida]
MSHYMTSMLARRFWSCIWTLVVGGLPSRITFINPTMQLVEDLISMGCRRATHAEVPSQTIPFLYIANRTMCQIMQSSPKFLIVIWARLHESPEFVKGA